jgi:hypothetical protein
MAPKRTRLAILLSIGLVIILYIGFGIVRFIHNHTPGSVTEFVAHASSGSFPSVAKIQSDLSKSEADVKSLESALAPLQAVRDARQAELEKARIPAETGYHSFFITDDAQRNYFKVKERIERENQNPDEAMHFAGAKFKLARGQERVADLRRKLELAKIVEARKSWLPSFFHPVNNSALVSSYDADVKAIAAAVDATSQFHAQIVSRIYLIGELLRTRKYSQQDHDKLVKIREGSIAHEKFFGRLLNQEQQLLNQRRQEVALLQDVLQTPAQRAQKAAMQRMMYQAIFRGMANLPDTSGVYDHMTDSFNQTLQNSTGCTTGMECTITDSVGNSHTGIAIH